MTFFLSINKKTENLNEDLKRKIILMKKYSHFDSYEKLYHLSLVVVFVAAI